ncbi:ABC transporter permease [Faunimonas sp. B44]|uniref:ABC transporter permease n=1 Tax=Faunimonas sp. B44 TaxID=3461493 RepID=UPI0040449D9D
MVTDQRTHANAEAVPSGIRASRLFALPGTRPGKALTDRKANAARDFLVHPMVLRVLSALVFCIAWEWAARIPISPAFPGFSETMGALWEMIADGSMGRAFAVTLQPLLIGLAISGALGVAIGVAMGLNDKAEWFASPIFIIMQAAPLAALIPLIVFAYGIGLTSKVLVVCIMAMPVIVLNSYSAVRHTPASLVEMGRSFLASRRQVIMRVILPAASPVIFAGLRLGAAAGFIGAVLAELLITPTGVGDLITYNRSIADYPKMYAAILSIMVFSVLFIELLERIEVTMFRPEKRAR